MINKKSNFKKVSFLIFRGLKKNYKVVSLFLISVLLIVIIQLRVSAILSNGSNAVDIIGQYTTVEGFTANYTQSTENNANGSVYELGLNGGSNQNVIDTVNHRLFLADSGNKRVLIFDLDSSNNLVDKTPDHVLGQSDFVSNTSQVTQNGMSGPNSLAYDSNSDILYVSDVANNRVLVFDLSSGVTDGMNASYVLGQSDFISNSSDTTQASLNSPEGLSYDIDNNLLFIADVDNNRILVFDMSSGISTGMNASYVLGQADFISNTATVSQSGISRPNVVLIDTTNQRLFSTDYDNARVLVFDLSSGITNGMDASNVLGQTDFDTGTTGLSQSEFNKPSGLAYDSTNDRLFVTDQNNNRVLIFDFTFGLTDGMNASYVLGQIDFDSNASGVTQSNLNYPRGLIYDSDNDLLYVSDNANNRVLIFDTSSAGGTVTVESITSTTSSGIKTTGNTLSIQVNFSDNVYVTETPTLTLETGDVDNLATYESGSGTDSLTFTYTIISTDTSDRLDVLSTTALSGTIEDSSGVSADLTLPTPYTTNSLGVNSLFKINPTLDIYSYKPAFDIFGQYTTTAGFIPSWTTSTYQNSYGSVYDLGFSGASYGDAIDSTNHRFFKVDSGNNRILIYDLDDNDNFVDKIPDYVLGQTDFVNNSSGLTDSTFNTPRAVYWDDTDERLFVSDSANNRVLVFYLSSGITNGMAAGKVLGQTDFVSNTAAVTQYNFNTTTGLAYDTTNKYLFVGESGNNRVMVFNLAGGITNGMNASWVIGKYYFTHTYSTSCYPYNMRSVYGLAYDNTNKRLFVVDGGNHRLMLFSMASGVSTKQSAIYMIGQPSYCAVYPDCDNYRLSSPRAITYDETNGRVFVADSGNNRIMVYTASATAFSKNYASYVLGQSSFGSCSATSAGQKTLGSPSGLVYDSVNGRLYVSQSGFNRMTVFDVAPVTASFTVSTTSTKVTEGSTKTFTVVLDQQPPETAIPTTDVVFNITSSDTTSATVSPSTLTFTRDDWDTAQTVTITGVSDTDVLNETNTITVTPVYGSSDANYATLDPKSVSVTLTDTTTGSLTITPTTATTMSEGTTNTSLYSVKLGTQPNSSVVVNVSTTSSDLTLNTTSLTFTTSNWSTAQYVSVTTPEDADAVSETNQPVIFSVGSSSDSHFTSLSYTQYVNITDNDTANIVISKNTATLLENSGTDQFTVYLSAQPSSNVILNVSSSSTSEVAISDSSLIFTSSDYSTPQTVTITGVDDNYDRNDTATITVATVDASSDSTFAGLSQSITSTLTDDDIASVSVSVVDNLTGEDGDTGSFQITLGAQPTSDVVIALSSSNTDEGTVSNSITITSANWNTPANNVVTVTGADDSVTDGAIEYTIVTGDVSSSDSAFDSLTADDVADVVMENQDNDPACIIVTPVSTTTTESGGTAIVQFSLCTQPGSGDVTIPVGVTDDTEVSLSAESITIANSDWNTPSANQITLTGVDDDYADGDVIYTLYTGDPTSDNEEYDALTSDSIADPTFTNTDNEVINFVVSPLSLTISEGKTNDSAFAVTLSSQPETGDTIVLNASTTSTKITLENNLGLTFDDSNWNTSQYISVTGVKDSDSRSELDIPVMFVISADETSSLWKAISGLQALVDVKDPNSSSSGGGGGTAAGKISETTTTTTTTTNLNSDNTAVSTETTTTSIEESTTEETTTNGEIAEETTSTLPSQLFDINLVIDEPTITTVEDLYARVVFTSFGTEPTYVDLTFDILDSNNQIVHTEIGNITVLTESVYNQEFSGFTLPIGKYTLRLTTLYNSSVEDEFIQSFEIVSESSKTCSSLFGLCWWWWILILVLIVVLWRILRKKNNKKPKEKNY